MARQLTALVKQTLGQSVSQRGLGVSPHSSSPPGWLGRSCSDSNVWKTWLAVTEWRFRDQLLGWQSHCPPPLLSLVLYFFYLQILLVLGERVGFFNLVLEFRWKCQCLRNYPATPRQQRTINLTLPHQIRAPHMFGCGVWQQQQLSAPLCLLLEEKTLSICFKFFQVQFSNFFMCILDG